MKVKAIKKYNDLQLNRVVLPDELLDVSEDRAKTLIEANVAVKVTTTTTKKVAGAKAKKSEV